MKVLCISNSNNIYRAADKRVLFNSNNGSSSSFSADSCDNSYKSDVSKIYFGFSLKNFTGNLSANSVQVIKFGAKNDLKSEDPVLEFGISLFDKIQTDKNTDIKEEVVKFLEENNMQGIKVLNIRELKGMNHLTSGCFHPEYTVDRRYNGGTLYLEDMDTSDIKAIIQQVGVITHELSHAYQCEKNKGSDTFSRAGVEDLGLINTISGFVNGVIRDWNTAQYLQLPPLQYAVDNCDTLGFDSSEIDVFNNDINKYGAIFPTSIVNVDDNTILNAYGGRKNFNDIIAKYFCRMLIMYNQIDSTRPYRNMEIYKLLQQYCVDFLREEVSAYEKNSQINKHHAGIDFDEKTLNDLTPMTYSLVADSLEKLNIEKFFI